MTATLQSIRAAVFRLIHLNGLPFSLQERAKVSLKIIVSKIEISMKFWDILGIFRKFWGYLEIFGVLGKN